MRVVIICTKLGSPVMRKDCMVMYAHSQMATLQSSVFMSVLGLVHAIINRQLRVIPSSSSLKTLSIALTASIYIGHLLNSPIASVLGSCVALGVVIEYARRTTTEDFLTAIAPELLAVATLDFA
jgi:hypothetical protein